MIENWHSLLSFLIVPKLLFISEFLFANDIAVFINIPKDAHNKITAITNKIVVSSFSWSLSGWQYFMIASIIKIIRNKVTEALIAHRDTNNLVKSSFISFNSVDNLLISSYMPLALS